MVIKPVACREREHTHTRSLSPSSLVRPLPNAAERRAGESRCGGASPPMRAERRPGCCRHCAQEECGRTRQEATGNSLWSRIRQPRHGREGKGRAPGRSRGAEEELRRSQPACVRSFWQLGKVQESGAFEARGDASGAQAGAGVGIGTRKGGRLPSALRERVKAPPEEKFVARRASTRAAGLGSLVPWRDWSCSATSSSSSLPSRRKARTRSPERRHWLSMGTGGAP